MRNGKNSAVVLAFLLAACAANSGVVATGKNEFMISKQAATGFSGLGKLKAKALREAGDHCSGLQKSIEVIATEESRPPYIFGNYPRVEVRFRCTANE